jgi:hypothetical protein
MAEESYNKFFKYINFYILFFISFYTMYRPNLELVGLFLCVGIYYIVYGLLNLDIITSPKNDDPVVIVLIVILRASFISFVFLISMFVNLHNTYASFGIPIQLTKENRQHLDTFKTLLVSNIVLTGIMAVLYFTAYKYDKPIIINDIEMKYAPFYNLADKSFLGYTSLIFRIFTTVALMYCTAYIIYISYFLSKLSTAKVIIPETNSDDPAHDYKPPSFPFNNSFFTNNSISGLFQNLNLNYITNYTPTL